MADPKLTDLMKELANNETDEVEIEKNIIKYANTLSDDDELKKLVDSPPKLIPLQPDGLVDEKIITYQEEQGEAQTGGLYNLKRGGGSYNNYGGRYGGNYGNKYGGNYKRGGGNYKKYGGTNRPLLNALLPILVARAIANGIQIPANITTLANTVTPVAPVDPTVTPVAPVAPVTPAVEPVLATAVLALTENNNNINIQVKSVMIGTNPINETTTKEQILSFIKPKIVTPPVAPSTELATSGGYKKTMKRRRNGRKMKKSKRIYSKNK